MPNQPLSPKEVGIPFAFTPDQIFAADHYSISSKISERNKQKLRLSLPKPLKKVIQKIKDEFVPAEELKTFTMEVKPKFDFEKNSGGFRFAQGCG